MTARIDPQRFLETVLPIVRQCAAASRVFYGDVADVGKKADSSLTGRRAQQASSVLTVLDAAFQDLILGAVHGRFPHIRCIAEERTPMRRAFAGNASDYVVILDPIDGTLHFQRGDAPYHVCVGLAHRGRMLAAAVARPNQDKLFTAIRGKGAWLQRGTRAARRLRLPTTPRTNRAFISTKARSFQASARSRHVQAPQMAVRAAMVGDRDAGIHQAADIVPTHGARLPKIDGVRGHEKGKRKSGLAQTGPCFANHRIGGVVNGNAHCFVGQRLAGA